METIVVSPRAATRRTTRGFRASWTQWGGECDNPESKGHNDERVDAA
jgi:hypothetical protein